MMTQADLEDVRNLVESLLSYLPLKLKTSVLFQEGEIQINVSGSDRPYLLSDHGETLLSLQYILAKMIRQKIPHAVETRVFVDSDGFLFRHEEDLRHLAYRSIQRARREGRRIKLPPMNPHERRIIHAEVARNEDLDSVSEGEGFFKQVIVLRRRY